jgi:murein DD-endopeptidase MepM/ murein hydrolase activator NlpD
MRLSTVVLAAVICLPGVHGAAACQLPEKTGAAAPLQTRKPLSGDAVRVVSGFGVRNHPILQLARMHTGVDWAAPVGTPVTAAGDGQVVAAGMAGEFGNRVLIDHGGGWQSLYGHLASLSVRAGDCVHTGTVVGSVGTSGLTTGPMVHFEVRREGQPVDPLVIAITREEQR